MSHTPTPVPPVKHDWLAALLSYLVPGLGQIHQGRTFKGVLFLVCLYTLFFYGQALGSWRNVYLPGTQGLPPVHLVDRNDFQGKGWRITLPEGVPTALGYRPQFLGQFWIGAAAWPALVQYMNYDKAQPRGPIFGNYQRAVEEDQINKMQLEGDKHWDLGWVYTVIAGALNVLVIYDALAGPAFREPPAAPERKEPVPT